MSKKLALVLAAAFVLASCSSSSSGPGGGGGNGGGGNGNKPAGFVGTCTGNYQTANGNSTVCTEYYSGTRTISTAELQAGCEKLGNKVGNGCEAAPTFSCRIVGNGEFTMIHRIYTPANDRTGWEQQCAGENGTLE